MEAKLREVRKFVLWWDRQEKHPGGRPSKNLSQIGASDAGNVMAFLSHIVGRIQVAAFLIHAARLNANQKARAAAFRVYIAELSRAVANPPSQTLDAGEIAKIEAAFGVVIDRQALHRGSKSECFSPFRIRAA
jgi:hypothetical protein